MDNPLQRMFSEIPRRYERVNHTLTFGLDVFWRRALAARAIAAGVSPARADLAQSSSAKGRAAGELRILDVCTGTGETAAYVLRRARPEALVVGADFTVPMMIEGRRQRGRERIAFVAAEATALPFPDASFDVATISFATRNLNVSREDLVRAFREFRRVLRPGGVFLNLETSRPRHRIVRALFDCYARFFVPRIGAVFSGSSTGYAYLSNTLRRFYGAEEVALILAEAGFSSVRFRRFQLGIVAFHEAVR